MSIKRVLLLLAAVSVLSLAAVACGPAEVGVGGIEVGFAPPGLQAEVAVDSPGPGYAWVPGYYDWQGGNYVWVAGTWTRPPHEGAVWVAPTYEQRGSKFMYHRGTWRDGRRDEHREDHHDDHHG